ncbi:hypothetical protein C8F04DRAFT_1232795 [Mycena alexandri]|uniref:Uncharacterized protein n=1 Tax=Mycena alexandri TaxID=1745969 RepID=A0AAD6X327_9AGAR|nr:hypothetical protein C8F04DRAFT_1232795 [Mycena alexandri]
MVKHGAAVWTDNGDSIGRERSKQLVDVCDMAWVEHGTAASFMTRRPSFATRPSERDMWTTFDLESPTPSERPCLHNRHRGLSTLLALGLGALPALLREAIGCLKEFLLSVSRRWFKYRGKYWVKLEEVQTRSRTRCREDCNHRVTQKWCHYECGETLTSKVIDGGMEPISEWNEAEPSFAFDVICWGLQFESHTPPSQNHGSREKLLASENGPIPRFFKKMGGKPRCYSSVNWTWLGLIGFAAAIPSPDPVEAIAGRRRRRRRLWPAPRQYRWSWTQIFHGPLHREWERRQGFIWIFEEHWLVEVFHYKPAHEDHVPKTERPPDMTQFLGTYTAGINLSSRREKLPGLLNNAPTKTPNIGEVWFRTSSQSRGRRLDMMDVHIAANMPQRILISELKDGSGRWISSESGRTTVIIMAQLLRWFDLVLQESQLDAAAATVQHKLDSRGELQLYLIKMQCFNLTRG